MNNFEERCKQLKAKHPEMDEASIQNQIKEQMIQELHNITPEEGKKMVKASNILLFPNWDIVDALIFNSISNNLGLQDPNKKEFIGNPFNDDQATLVMWSLRRGSRVVSS